MKELIGTEKQISWANKIRNDYMNWYDHAIESMDEDIADDENTPEDIAELTEQKTEIVDKFARILGEKTSAAWWIDHHSADPAVAAGITFKPDYLSPIVRLTKSIR